MPNAELPADIVIDPANPPPEDELPELPPGYVWGLKITADAEVIKADVTKEV